MIDAGCQNPNRSAHAKRIPTLPASARPENTTGLSVDEVNKGAKLFVGKCARCHPLYDPRPYTNTEFNHWMMKMGKEARLKPAQEDLLERYLGAFRGSPTNSISAKLSETPGAAK